MTRDLPSLDLPRGFDKIDSEWEYTQQREGEKRRASVLSAVAGHISRTQRQFKRLTDWATVEAMFFFSPTQLWLAQTSRSAPSASKRRWTRSSAWSSTSSAPSSTRPPADMRRSKCDAFFFLFFFFCSLLSLHVC